MTQSVYVITQQIRDASGEFSTFVDGVYATKKLAWAELKRIQDSYNSQGKWIRAKQPGMQIDDLSVDKLENGFYECAYFYSIHKRTLIIE